ncbi:nuclear transport factor 2 family protein [Marinicaulis aureus]|uniref:Nuclear transport factor 2 family protein n=1 Tax=Hyphococcus aureus TaxID=2666033 RepID=A0ABW1KVE6_9PROT
MMTKSEIGTREWIEHYLGAFNNHDFEGFSAFYAPDVEFYGQAANLKGAAQIVEFYTMVMDCLDEHIELKTFVGSKKHVAIEIITTLDFKKDWPDFAPGPMKAGDRRQTVNFIFYDINENGLFSRIRSSRYAVIRER